MDHPAAKKKAISEKEDRFLIVCVCVCKGGNHSVHVTINYLIKH